MADAKKRDSARSAIKRSLELSKNASYTKQQLESYIELLREQWSRFTTAQEKVEESCGTEAIELEQNEREQGENWYIDALSNFKINLDMLQSNTTTANANERAHCTAVVPNIKLPTFDLPHFDGDPTTWLTFFDSFNAIVLKQESLTGSQKLHYLRCCLSKEPLQLITNFKLQDANFIEAWNSLKTRYNIPRVIKDHHFRAIFATQKVTYETATAIKSVLDPITQNVRALKALSLPVQYWDDWLIHIVVHRLPNETRRQWELTLKEDVIPNYEDLQEFLESRCRSLEIFTTSETVSKPSKGFAHNKNNNKVSAYHASQRNQLNDKLCFYCSGEHKIYQCQQFRSISVDARASAARSKGACTNCLSLMHKHATCRSSSTCRICRQRHHTLLHLSLDDNANANSPPANPQTSFSDNTNATPSTSQASCSATTAFSTADGSATKLILSSAAEKPVLPATALVKAYDYNGKQHVLRALFDSSSHSTFVTEACVEKLELSKKRSDVIISGIGCSKGLVKGEISLQLTSMTNKERYRLSALVLTKLTEFLPTTKIHNSNWSHIAGLTLADPEYYVPARIDLIIGSDEMYTLLEPEIIKGAPETPVAQKTVFGWVLFGKVNACDQSQNTSVCLHSDVDLTRAIVKSWALDELPETRFHTPEEGMCETLFDTTHTRDANGRFIVRLPFKPNFQLGLSKNIAVQSWLRMEKRLSQNSEHRNQYHAFLQDMLNQGHMEPVHDMPLLNFYMPHHSVIKESSSTTKTRVVFNASQKTTNAASLNDVLMVGPTLQHDLVSILNRFQTHKYALIGDVAGMYRQVMVAQDHTDYQRIVFRKTPLEPLQDYRMLRVTYGVASSAHHAVKALHQTAMDAKTTHPLASSVILRDFKLQLVTRHS